LECSVYVALQQMDHCCSVPVKDDRLIQEISESCQMLVFQVDKRTPIESFTEPCNNSRYPEDDRNTN
jgi:hypothetical protein